MFNANLPPLLILEFTPKVLETSIARTAEQIAALHLDAAAVAAETEYFAKLFQQFDGRAVSINGVKRNIVVEEAQRRVGVGGLTYAAYGERVSLSIMNELRNVIKEVPRPDHLDIGVWIPGAGGTEITAGDQVKLMFYNNRV